jgi:hypothetical protein
MRFHCLVVALALLTTMASDSWGQSKQPTPPPTQPAQTNQAAKPYERGTEQSPVVVKVLPTKESEEKAAADVHREDEKTANDARLARFTELLFWATGALSVIALFQLFVFGWQGIQLKRSVSAAKDATELGNREFIATHRPRVIVRYIQGPLYDEQRRTYVFVTVVNTGANTATIEALGADLAKRDAVNEGWVAPGLDAEAKSIEPVTLLCGERHVFTVTAKTTVSDDEIYRQTIGRFDLCAAGELRYRDANGVSRYTGFFRVLDDKGVSFILSERDSELEHQD